MKKDFCLVLMCLAAVTLCAQPAGHFRQGDHHWDKVERLMAKNGYTHRLASYRTSDNYQFCTFSYSGDGRLIAIRDTVRNEYSLIDSLSYNEDGQMVRMSGWQLLDNRWENVYYIDYTYENGNLASRTNYNNFDGSWEQGGVYRYSYDPEGRILLSELTMGGIVFQMVEYTYNNDGNLVCELWSGYDGAGLTPSEKIVTEWVDGQKSAEYDSVSEDGVRWMFNGRSEYRYDGDGNCTEFHHYDMAGSEVERSLFDINADLPLSRTYMPWTPETTRPKTFQNTHAYDREAWYTVDVDHVLQYVCDYIYQYEEASAGIGTAERARLSVFPNPAHGFVTIDGLNSRTASVRILDVMGRTVTTGRVSPESNVLDVRMLIPGCYVVQIATADGVSSERLVIDR